MPRANRLLQLVCLLGGRRPRSMAELVEHFGVSDRTLYRDLDDLGQCNIPVTRVDGGYRLVEGATLRPLGTHFQVPEEFSLDGYLETAWTVYRGETTHEVVLRFDAALARSSRTLATTRARTFARRQTVRSGTASESATWMSLLSGFWASAGSAVWSSPRRCSSGCSAWLPVQVGRTGLSILNQWCWEPVPFTPNRDKLEVTNQSPWSSWLWQLFFKWKEWWMTRYWFGLTVILTAGCATAPMLPAPQKKVGEHPDRRSVVERSVGEVVYEIYEYRMVPAGQVTQPVTEKVGRNLWSIDPTDLLVPHREGRYIAYCTRDEGWYVSRLDIASRVCLRDTSGDDEWDQWRAPTSQSRYQAWRPISAPIPYEPVMTTADEDGGFRYELVYQGIAGNVVRLMYREYVGDFVRAAFQQDLSYTLKSDDFTEVSFRETRLRIYSADNNSIRYEVLSGFTR